MISILENRPALTAEVEKVAETAGYLWQKGWAERNGGNITVNITEQDAGSSAKAPRNVCVTLPAARWTTARLSASPTTAPTMR